MRQLVKTLIGTLGRFVEQKVRISFSFRCNQIYDNHG